jgi:acyl carrier protein
MPAIPGVDLVRLDDVSASVAAFGDRWARRVCTDRELSDCVTAAGWSAGRLAARFAAKEATLKVLEVRPGAAIPWRSIEVRSGARGRAPRLELHEPAARTAEAAGIAELRLDLSCTATHAAAFVLGLAPDGTRGPGDARELQGSSRKAEQPMTTSVEEEIRRVLGDHARLTTDPASVAPRTDLYQAGMTSHASVNVMLALEDAFDVEFPDHLLKRSVFESVASIADAVAELRGAAA